MLENVLNLVEEEKEISVLIGETIGEASMCWSEIPKGVFDSVKACSLVDKLHNRYLQLENKIEELQNTKKQ